MNAVLTWNITTSVTGRGMYMLPKRRHGGNWRIPERGTRSLPVSKCVNKGQKRAPKRRVSYIYVR